MAGKRSGPGRSERAAAAKAAGKKVFRFNAHKVGLTYSAPRELPENPIPDASRIASVLEERHGTCMYTIGTELHQSGKRHYHADIKFDALLDSEDHTLFNVDGVSPDIIRRPGAGWKKYCEKHGDVCTNIPANVFAQALAAPTVRDGMEIIALQDPGAYLRFGESIERNLRRRLAPPPQPKVYFGPFISPLVDTNWDPTTHSLLVWGPPGVGKTQWARYYMSHRWGEYDYIKGSHEQLKKLHFDKPFIFDEVYMCNDKDPWHKPAQSREITDVENGGAVECRNSNVDIPPGVPRIFLSNVAFPFRNPADSVYGRRVVSVQW